MPLTHPSLLDWHPTSTGTPLIHSYIDIPSQPPQCWYLLEWVQMRTRVSCCWSISMAACASVSVLPVPYGPRISIGGRARSGGAVVTTTALRWFSFRRQAVTHFSALHTSHTCQAQRSNFRAENRDFDFLNRFFFWEKKIFKKIHPGITCSQYFIILLHTGQNNNVNCHWYHCAFKWIDWNLTKQSNHMEFTECWVVVTCILLNFGLPINWTYPIMHFTHHLVSIFWSMNPVSVIILYGSFAIGS